MRQTAIPLSLVVLLLLISVILRSAAPAVAQSGGDYELTSSSVDGGGATSSGGSYSLYGISGQPDAGGESRGGSYSVDGGFWNSNTGGGATVVTLSSFSARSSAGLEASLVWPWLVGVATLVTGGVLWVRRRLSTRGNFK
jgi:hypothetical protein